jgi:DNA-binding transcriptional regulator PaaX
MEKRDLLGYVGFADSATALDVAREFGVTEATAGMALLRLLRQGLLERGIHREVYTYRLSVKGRVRLHYFRITGQA